MSTTTAIAIYFIIWWTVLFVVLPWGVRSQHEAGEIVPGSEPGAPVVPNLLRKAGWTTLVSTIVFGLFYAAYVYRWVTLEDLSRWFGPLMHS